MEEAINKWVDKIKEQTEGAAALFMLEQMRYNLLNTWNEHLLDSNKQRLEIQDCFDNMVV